VDGIIANGVCHTKKKTKKCIKHAQLRKHQSKYNILDGRRTKKEEEE